MLNKSVYFSPGNLLFVRPIYKTPAQERRRVVGKIIFLSSTLGQNDIVYNTVTCSKWEFPLNELMKEFIVVSCTFILSFPLNYKLLEGRVVLLCVHRTQHSTEQGINSNWLLLHSQSPRYQLVWILMKATHEVILTKTCHSCNISHTNWVLFQLKNNEDDKNLTYLMRLLQNYSSCTRIVQHWKRYT